MENPSPNPAQPKVKIWVKLFVLFHIVAITSYALPNPPESILSGRVLPGGTEWLVYWNHIHIKHSPPVEVYTGVTGFWQYWDMFAPNPSHTDTWGDAEVVYRNGAVKHFTYPRIYSLPLWQKFLSERYRKFFERVSDDKFPYMWPSFGAHIALMCDDPKNPPVQVKLFRHFREVNGPDKPQERLYKVKEFYTYVVDQKELARLRKVPL